MLPLVKYIKLMLYCGGPKKFLCKALDKVDAHFLVDQAKTHSWCRAFRRILTRHQVRLLVCVDIGPKFPNKISLYNTMIKRRFFRMRCLYNIQSDNLGSSKITKFPFLKSQGGKYLHPKYVFLHIMTDLFCLFKQVLKN